MLKQRDTRVAPQILVPQRFRHGSSLSQRARGLEKNHCGPYAPPEDWYEPSEDGRDFVGSYRVVVQKPGKGYRHVLTPHQIRQRLSELPEWMLEPLEVVQLSRMTRKKQGFPCYGMQWGSSVYLYPIEEDLIEYYARPPRPAQLIEARMYGGRWRQVDRDEWQLIWTEKSVRDYYLNNILIHELGHLLDNRNTRSDDRERFAEWFAIEHGYRRGAMGRNRPRIRKRTIVRRHRAV